MKRALSLFAALMLAGSVFAQNPGGQGGPGGPGGQAGQHPPGPPPEAIDACKGKKDGDTATMQTPRGQMQGTCRLVLVPQQPPGQGRGPGGPQSVR